MKKLLFIFGTRPEAIKMAPVIKAFQGFHDGGFTTFVAVTAQHRQMLDQVLSLFRIQSNIDLDIMTKDQSLAQITARALEGLDRVIAGERPDFVFVQGDTTTTFAGALAAFYQRVPVGHIEAGLRTYNRFRPYPEEINRVMTSILTDLHFAPTARSRDNLLRENVPESRIIVTGNTVIDALLDVASRDYTFSESLGPIFADQGKRILLLTTHRRENHGGPMEDVCRAVLDILRLFEDVEVVFPVHLSPRVREVVYPLLNRHPRVHLIAPLDYLTFVNAIKRSYLILSDSGGVQEEAPSLGKPVLVLRESTERPEAVDAGTVRLVGTDRKKIVEQASMILSDAAVYEAMSKTANPYGDGKASERIVEKVRQYLSGVGLP